MKLIGVVKQRPEKRD